MFGPEGPVLAGKLDGKRAFMRQLEKVAALTEPALVFLDFAGIELATSSFLSEAVVHFRDHLRLGNTPSYLAVANLNPSVSEELEDLLKRSADALIACRLSEDGRVDSRQLLGRLEPKLQETFERVEQRGEATAVELYNDSTSTDQIGPTAWNNRLNLLSAKSLLMETSLGRTKKFRPLLETV